MSQAKKQFNPRTPEQLGRELLDVLIYDKHGEHNQHLRLKDVQIAKSLIKQGADVTLKSDGETTALLVVSLFHQPDLAQLLIDKGADVNACNKSGATPLMFAAFRKDANTVKVLVEAGADPRLIDNAGRTAIEYGYHTSTAIGRYLEKIAQELNKKDIQAAYEKNQCYKKAGQPTQKTLPRKKASFKKKPFSK